MHNCKDKNHCRPELPAHGGAGHPNEERSKPAGRLVYKRSSDIFSNPQVFQDDIHPGRDVRQGRSGDCWLMCALSACVASFPGLSRSCFPTARSTPMDYTE